MRHLRAIVRAGALIVWTLVMYAALMLGLPFAFVFKNPLRWRGLVFHKWAKATAAILGLKVAVSGTPPTPPFLLVSNHLSYLDVLAFASQRKCVFVARGDLAGWPVVGLLCRAAGTIFVDREKRKDVARVNGVIDQALANGQGVVLFAEGTSTRGDTVLPFKSSLLEQAARASLAVSYAALSYRTNECEPPAHLSVCWWGGMTFVKHLIGILYLSEIHTTVAFGAEPIKANDRKVLAERLWIAVRDGFIPVVEINNLKPENSSMSPASTQGSRPSKTLRSWKWRIALGYLALLIASHIVRWVRPEAPGDNGPAVMVQTIDGEQQLSEQIRVAYREYRPSATEALPVIILIHGSPGGKEDFRSLAPQLDKRYRVIAPDLPGFGSSTADVPDYSIRAHARYVIEMMDAHGIERAHLLGFSMGGGVVLNIADMAPNRVQSITMLSAIGVQEAELLGDYHLNHALHGAQLAAIWLFKEAVPDFGLLDHSMLDRSYARNFYDSDQRPLREFLTRFEQPMLIIHGSRDVLVPFEAAVEHHRIVPQSEAEFRDDNHFMVFGKGAMLAPKILEFLDRVDQGKAVTRATADADRLARAALPYDRASIPKAVGVTALVLMMLIAASTLVSEDLTCIGAGVMVAQGRIDFVAAALACFLGIFVGDVLLFLAGRYLGRPALARVPLKWFVRPEDVERSSAWFNRRGIVVIAASRFVPGMRLPTYFAAGLLNTNLFRFSIYFLLAAAVWTPLLVGLSSVLGAEVIKSALLARQNALVQVLVAGVVLYLAVKLVIQTASYRGRRLLVSKWRRLTRWEFWPMWAFYPPVICYVLFLAVKHRSLTVFTAANPAIPASGFIGESKLDILRGLSSSNGYLARSSLIGAPLDLNARIDFVKCFMGEHHLSFPVVLKPDQGQRGTGVAIIRSTEETERYLSSAAVETIIQEYASGEEFGVFYYRRPDEGRGRIFSITEKRMPFVTGDGASTLEKLILADDRAVCMARFLLDKHKARANEAPAKGERVQLVEIGTHCKGALFLDGSWIKTPELEKVIDEISRSFDGFYFGRFDIRTPSVDDFRAGRNFKIVELNGVTSEATHIYDPRNSLIDAYRVLFEQWRLAFEIGAKNRERGVKPSSLRELLKVMRDYRKRPTPR